MSNPICPLCDESMIEVSGWKSFAVPNEWECQTEGCKRNPKSGCIQSAIQDGMQVELLIPIALLPDCHARECLMELAATENESVYVVAKVGYADDWASYIGYPLNCKHTYHDYAQLTTPYGVASNGDKLDKATAEALFPYLKERSYRR